MNPNERPIDSFKREVYEEAGISCIISDTLPTIIELRYSMDYQKINHCFLATTMNSCAKQRQLEVHEKEDGLEIVWYPLQKGITILLEQEPKTDQQKFIETRDKLIVQQALLQLYNCSGLFVWG